MSDQTDQYIHSVEAQIIGRVFTHDGAIHFVLGTDPGTGMARCSRRMDDGPGITFLPMTDVHALLQEQADASTDEMFSGEDPDLVH
jgi:hypothetical protein